jgi:hypothetical protein
VIDHADVIIAWAKYGTGKPLREGFAEWLADQINAKSVADPHYNQRIITECINHYPFCIQHSPMATRWDPEEERRYTDGARVSDSSSDGSVQRDCTSGGL